MGGGGRWGLVEMWRVEGMECINKLYRIVSYRIVLYIMLYICSRAPALSVSALLHTLPSCKGHSSLVSLYSMLKNSSCIEYVGTLRFEKVQRSLVSSIYESQYSGEVFFPALESNQAIQLPLLLNI